MSEELTFYKVTTHCYHVRIYPAVGNWRGVGRIDRSPMNPKVWIVDMHNGTSSGHTGLAAAKKAARVEYAAKGSGNTVSKTTKRAARKAVAMDSRD